MLKALVKFSPTILLGAGVVFVLAIGESISWNFVGRMIGVQLVFIVVPEVARAVSGDDSGEPTDGIDG